MMRVAALATVVIAAAGVAMAQQRFATTTALVRFDVNVSDGRGPIRGLTVADFEVRDNGVRQDVHVQETNDGPLDVVVVGQPLPAVAVTSSEQAGRLRLALDALLARVETTDRLGVIVASAPPWRLRALLPGTGGVSVEAFLRGSDSAVFDAAAVAMGECRESERQCVVVLFSSGADFRSTVSFDRLAFLAQRLGPAFVSVSSPIRVAERVGVSAETRGGISLEATEARVSGFVFPRTLVLLSKLTGGLTVDLGRGDPVVLIADLLARLRTHYVVTWEPTPVSGWHPVTVKVARKGASVVAREGYRVD
jgi:hypothetical protein